MRYPVFYHFSLLFLIRPNVELVVDDVDAHLQQEALNLVDNINKVFIIHNKLFCRKINLRLMESDKIDHILITLFHFSWKFALQNLKTVLQHFKSLVWN